MSLLRLFWVNIFSKISQNAGFLSVFQKICSKNRFFQDLCKNAQTHILQFVLGHDFLSFRGPFGLTVLDYFTVLVKNLEFWPQNIRFFKNFAQKINFFRICAKNAQTHVLQFVLGHDFLSFRGPFVLTVLDYFTVLIKKLEFWPQNSRFLPFLEQNNKIIKNRQAKWTSKWRKITAKTNWRTRDCAFFA